jgi:hypothetical protein
MRIAAAVFVGAHGVGHVLWFMSAWMPSALETRRGPVALTFLPDLSVTGTAGKALGLLALVVVLGFLASAWGIWTQASWWPRLLIASVVASGIVLATVWNPVGTVSVNALAADIGLAAATFMPWGQRLLGAH